MASKEFFHIIHLLTQIGDPPEIYQLEQLTHPDSRTVSIINDVAAKWEELAIALGFDAPTIEHIKRDHSSACKEACREMFTKWLRMDHTGEMKPVCWTTLIESLNDAEFSSLAKALEEILARQKTY